MRAAWFATEGNITKRSSNSCATRVVKEVIKRPDNAPLRKRRDHVVQTRSVSVGRTAQPDLAGQGVEGPANIRAVQTIAAR